MIYGGTYLRLMCIYYILYNTQDHNNQGCEFEGLSLVLRVQMGGKLIPVEICFREKIDLIMS